MTYIYDMGDLKQKDGSSLPLIVTIPKEIYINLSDKTDEIGKLLNHMINHPEKYGVTKSDN